MLPLSRIFFCSAPFVKVMRLGITLVASNLGKISRQNAQRELESTADAIAAAGESATLMRPPYGS